MRRLVSAASLVAAATLTAVIGPPASAAPATIGGSAAVADCPEPTTDVAFFPRAVPRPSNDYVVRGYLRAECRHLLHLALEVDDLKPEQRHLVSRLRAKGWRGIVWSSHLAKVRTGLGEEEYEWRRVFDVTARGHGYRLDVDLGFVGVAPRWGGTALIDYRLRPLR